MPAGLSNRIGPRSTAHWSLGVFGASLWELSITEELGLKLCPWAAFAVCFVGFARTSRPENAHKPSNSRKTPEKKVFFPIDRTELRLVEPRSYRNSEDLAIFYAHYRQTKFVAENTTPAPNHCLGFLCSGCERMCRSRNVSLTQCSQR